MNDRMSSIAEAAQGNPVPTLADLRAELDGLDDGLHELLMRRAEVVVRIAALGAKGRVPFRPGREARIIRRLLARHHGALPALALPRLWRELFAATTAIQGAFVISVCDAAGDGAFVACAREHFGALTPLRVARTPAQAIREVSTGTATAAVVPLPRDEEAAPEAWWTALLPRDEPRIHVVARLPFWEPRPDGASRAQALVIAAVPPDPSGDDRSLIGLELPPELSRARLNTALGAVGLSAGSVLLRRELRQPMAYALIDVEGFMTDDDARLGALTRALPPGSTAPPPVVLGCYAVPVPGTAT
jgi:chorismate mutase